MNLRFVGSVRAVFSPSLDTWTRPRVPLTVICDGTAWPATDDVVDPLSVVPVRDFRFTHWVAVDDVALAMSGWRNMASVSCILAHTWRPGDRESGRYAAWSDTWVRNVEE